MEVDPRDIEVVRALLAERTGPAVRPVVRAGEPTSGGVVVADDAGRVLDNRFETRLDNAWPRLRAPLASSWPAQAQGAREPVGDER